MTENMKVAGIITSGFMCGMLAIVGQLYANEVLMNIAYAFGGVFGSFWGLPFIGKVGKAMLSVFK